MCSRGWIESGERAGEVGKPALKPAALAQPLVSGPTGNTSPCSPRQTCSQQGWWWPGADGDPHSQVMEATEVFWGASTHTVHPAALPPASPKSLGCSTRLPSLVRRRLLRLKTRPCVCVCVIKPDSASSCRHPHRRAGRYGQCSPQGFSHAAGSARSSFPVTAEPPAPSLVTRDMSSFPLCHNREQSSAGGNAGFAGSSDRRSQTLAGRSAAQTEPGSVSCQPRAKEGKEEDQVRLGSKHHLPLVFAGRQPDRGLQAESSRPHGHGAV